MNALLPRQVDNTFHGRTAALWIFGAVVLLRIGVGLGSIFNGRDAATSADGIPLDTYTPAGAQTVLALFGMLGLARFVSGLLCVVVLVRYRALVPLMFALILSEQVGRRLVLYFIPIVRSETARVGAFNDVLLAAMVVGLLLSLWPRSVTTARQTRRPLGNGVPRDPAVCRVVTPSVVNPAWDARDATPC